MEDVDDGWPRVQPTKVAIPPLCFSVHGAYHAMVRRLQAVVRDLGLGPSDAFVLVRLRRSPMSPPSELRLALGLHRSTLSSILDRLERRGFLTRERSAFDGRRFELQLTAIGQMAADHASIFIDELEEELRTYISPAQRRGAAEAYSAMIAASRPDGVLDV